MGYPKTKTMCYLIHAQLYQVKPTGVEDGGVMMEASCVQQV